MSTVPGSPVGNPPSEYPPPPPANFEQQDPSSSSYQHPSNNSNNGVIVGGGNSSVASNGSRGGSSRAAAAPKIRHYHDDSEQQQRDPRDFFFVARGDASLRPNTGETNVYDTAVFGLALHELLENLRLANIVAALAATALLLTSWFVRLLTGKFGKLVLSAYLAFLSLVLLGTEVVGIFKFQSADAWLSRNFGLLHHPVGKSIYIFLLSTICFGIGGIPEFILGGLYLVCSLLLLYVWFSYPDFRRRFTTDDEEDDEEQRRRRAAAESSPRVSWSDYTTSSFFKKAAAGIRGKGGERTGEKASLLGSAARK